MRHLENDGEHIWLRQSATFTVHGQTRTVEIAVPIRPGASASEIEALLAEAGVGMERLSQHLDTQIASLLTEQRPPAATASASNGTAVAQPVAAPVVAAAMSPMAPPQRTATPAPTPVATPATTTPPASATPRASAPRPPAPAPAADEHALASPATPAPATAAASAAAMPATSSTGGGADLTRAEFLAAAAELGLNANQAMERLNVRSLQGLNLREALEALRRQLLRADAPSADAASAPATRPTPPATPPTARPAAAASKPSTPRYFEEEDDEPDISLVVDENGILSESHSPYTTELDGAGGQAAGTLAEDDLDDFDDLRFEDELDEVADLNPLPPVAGTRAALATMPTATPAPNRRPTTAPAASATPATPAQPPATPSNARRAEAIERLTQLRMIRGGGVPTAQQRNALRNVVVKPLGEEETKTLVQDIWRLGNERLGAEQYDALISWGKRDEFEAEVAAVNEVLRAEHEQALAASEPAAAPAAPPAAAPTAQRPRAGRTAASDAPTNPPRNR